MATSPIHMRSRSVVDHVPQKTFVMHSDINENAVKSNRAKEKEGSYAYIILCNSQPLARLTIDARSL